MNEEKYNLLVKRFYNYIDGFKEKDGNYCKLLKEKVEHIKRVSSNALFIANNEKWSKEDCQIAELCGLYHDIGRFSQYQKYKTFSDSKSVNHGEQGFSIINEYHFFDILEEKEAESILDAVHYHNSLNLPESLSENSVRFTNLTRDADKIDIFFMLTEAIRTNSIYNHQDLLWNLPMGEANPEIIKKLLNNTQALYSEIKSGTDVCLLQLCWLYGMNYKSSLLKIKENMTVELISSIIPKTLENQKCIEHINSYILNLLA